VSAPVPWSLPCSSGSKSRQFPEGITGIPPPTLLIRSSLSWYCWVVADSGGSMRDDDLEIGVGEFWTWKLEVNGKSWHKSTTLVITAGRYTIIVSNSIICDTVSIQFVGL